MNVLKITRNSLPPLAYIKTRATGVAGPVNGGIFCPGFMGNMTGPKAVRCEEYFAKKGLNFVRFDYTDVGSSVDEQIPPKFSFKQWKDDVATVLSELTEGRQILIGSSMGGWLSLLMALENPERVAGLVLVSTAVDFFSRFKQMIPNEMHDKLEKGKILYIDRGDRRFPIHKQFFVESEPLELLGNESIDVKCPVRMLHSIDDVSAPFAIAVKLIKKLSTDDVQLRLIKNSNHRMNSESDMDLLMEQLDSVFAAIQMNSSKL